MNNEAILNSFNELMQECHDNRTEAIRPIESNVIPHNNHIPMLFPAVEDENLRPLLLSWYYAGFYSGRYQALQELKEKQQK